MTDILSLFAKRNEQLKNDGKTADVVEPDVENLHEQYDTYLDQHIGNVQKGFKWLCDNLPEVVPDDLADNIEENIRNHDNSKYEDAEYMPYAFYFYGKIKPEKSKVDVDDVNSAIDSEFNYAWLHHIHANPHHWQYWILVHDDESVECLEMPYEYIIEMICDWWAFSWKTGKLNEIFSWYESHKAGIQLNDNSRKTLEDVLDKLKTKLNA